jgi:hypothetical protein
MIRLFVETGIQYIDLEQPLDFNDAEANRPCRFRLLGGREARDAKFLDANVDEDEESGVSNDGCVDFTARDALALFSRQWIPIPYHSTNPFWVRAFLEPNVASNGQYYDVVLACDTHTRSETRNDGLGLLRGKEIGYTFSVNPDINIFWEHREVKRTVMAAWKTWRDASGDFSRTGEAQPALPEETATAAMAKLRTLIRFLAKKLPNICVSMGTETETIDTHLVLDLGNCRTCGIIVETSASQPPLSASLEIRSHELPCRRIVGPFESHMQFVRATGAKPGATPDDGRFAGISLIRLGVEALEAGLTTGVSGVMASMSSPKRYLWDDRPRPTDWSFASSSTETESPIEGAMLRYIDPVNPYREPQVAMLPNPTNPRYSRKTGLVFFLVEILEQAFAQINSFVHRQQMPLVGSESRRRILRSLVLVHPSGMTSMERKELEQGAKRAIDIWYEAYRDPIGFRTGALDRLPVPPVQPKPAVRIQCDEATAVQTCYVYGEVQSLKGDARGFFASMGKPRNGRQTVRLASLDIGGGTTDLVISDFVADPDVIGFTCMEQKLLFRDGLSLGGDDVVRTVLTDLIFRDMAQQLDISPKEWQSLFTQVSGAVDPKWEAVRRQLVNRVWIPVVRYFWGMVENDMVETRLTLRKILSDGIYPTDLIARFNECVSQKCQGRTVDISTVELTLNPAEFNATVRKVFSRMLYTLCDVVSQFDCDGLIVAGRAAGLGELMKMLTEYCPVPPARITSLQGYPVTGTWFPFARNGVISDAKSCVVVGATIHLIATQFGGQFVLRPKGTDTNTAIIGIVEPNQKLIPNGNVIFHPNSSSLLSKEIMFAGHLWIGFRNIDDEWAYSNALYEVCWASSMEKQISDGQRGGMAQAIIRLGCSPEDRFNISVNSAHALIGTGKTITRDSIALKLHTLYMNDYWLDTGCFHE